MKMMYMTRGQLTFLSMEHRFITFPAECSLFLFPADSRDGDMARGRMMAACKASKDDFGVWLNKFKQL